MVHAIVIPITRKGRIIFYDLKPRLYKLFSVFDLGDAMSVFDDEKKRALERLERSGADGEVEELLQRINELDDYFTTSSCSGRIVVICLPEIGAKREAVFLGKWHRPVRKEEVFEAIHSAASSRNGDVWFITQSPIMHVACRSLEKATALLRLALESGFKYSGIKAIAQHDGKVMVEILSTERMDVPLATDGSMMCSDAHLEFILAKSNFMLKRGKEKLERLCSGLHELR
jgi:tRNA wybutosine-synthesizing protein 3